MIHRTASPVIKDSQSHGVTVSHENGQLIISGPSPEIVQSLALKIDQFSEMILPVTASQWNQLMSIPSNGLSKFQELKEPFETNPNVTMIPLAKSDKDAGPVILFVGTVDAVSSAHRCFVAALSKTLELGRLVVIVCFGVL